MRTSFFDSFNKNNHFLNDFTIIKKTLTESLLDVRKKNAKDMTDADFAIVLSCDPLLSDLENVNEETLATANESYSKWLIKMFKKGEIQSNSPEDIRNHLKLFDNAKRRRNLLQNNDINAYDSLDAVKQALSNLNQLSIHQQNKDAKKNQRQLQGKKEPGIYMNGNVELLFNGNDWEIWSPLTFTGSKALRRGATWCTGGDTPTHYDSYKQRGELFVIIDKSNEDNKYQLFAPIDLDERNKEFRDAENESVPFRKFCHENPEVLQFFSNSELVLQSYPDLEDPDAVNREWSDEKEEDVVNEYNLTYDEHSGCIAMFIPYDTLLETSEITDPEDYRMVASEGYLDYPNTSNKEGLANLKRDMMASYGFAEDSEWENTHLFPLYEMCTAECQSKENNNLFNTSLKGLDFDSKNASFEKFCGLIFNTIDKDRTPEIKMMDEWLSAYNPNYTDLFVSCFSMQPVTDAIADYVYDQLRNRDWSFTTGPRSTRDVSRLYSENFYYVFKDYYTVEEFYNEFTHQGTASIRDILRDYNLLIYERDDSVGYDYYEHIDTRYFGNDSHIDDARQFCEELLGDISKLREYEV